MKVAIMEYSLGLELTSLPTISYVWCLICFIGYTVTFFCLFTSRTDSATPSNH